MHPDDDGKTLRRFRILVVPLDWGLGHATRCIPIIKELMSNHCEVWLAGERAQERLLRLEFPELTFLQLKGYRVKYSKSKAGLLWKVLGQLPKIRGAIRSERRWLHALLSCHRIDAVISDNRYGLYHTNIPSYFITHQLAIKSGLGESADKLLQRWIYKFINRFTECWVPDIIGDQNFAGDLSHPKLRPLTTLKYVGLLSRFPVDTASSFRLPASNENNNHLLFILSGPEPQRSILENKILRDIPHYPYTATVVRGLPGSNAVTPTHPNVKFYNHLPALELSDEMAKAQWVISRSGYSTVMDVIAMGKKSILIPTPGQPEQEYLARHLFKNRLAYTVDQRNFSIESALDEAADFPYQIPESNAQTHLKHTMADLVNNLRKSADMYGKLLLE